MGPGILPETTVGKHNPPCHLQMNEWMNDAFIQCFIVYCCTPKALYNHVGGSPRPPPVCSIHLGVWVERMDGTHLSMFTPSRIALTESARETVSLLQLGTISTFLSWARDCTTFTLHDLTDFYVERGTAHPIKRNDHSCFNNCCPNLKAKLKLKLL